MIKLSKEEGSEQKIVICCVINCQREIPIEKAIKINDKFFCPTCGVAYYRSNLNL
jgi:predicted RNA-binding Zn-ribbon protein involved in translation (DUF1610 family)